MIGERLVPNPQVIMTELGDGTGVLLHLDTKFYYSLNATGVAVWKALAGADAAGARGGRAAKSAKPGSAAAETSAGGGGATVEALVDVLTAAFDVERATAERDVGELVAELSAEGLVRAAPEPR